MLLNFRFAGVSSRSCPSWGSWRCSLARQLLPRPTNRSLQHPANFKQSGSSSPVLYLRTAFLRNACAGFSPRVHGHVSSRIPPFHARLERLITQIHTVLLLFGTLSSGVSWLLYRSIFRNGLSAETKCGERPRGSRMQYSFVHRSRETARSCELEGTTFAADELIARYFMADNS